jgi:hypothetical protein
MMLTSAPFLRLIISNQCRTILCLAVSQILDSLEDTQWLTIGDRVELDFLQKLFEDKQLQTLLEVRTKKETKTVSSWVVLSSCTIVSIPMKFVHTHLPNLILYRLFWISSQLLDRILTKTHQWIFVSCWRFYWSLICRYAVFLSSNLDGSSPYVFKSPKGIVKTQRLVQSDSTFLLSLVLLSSFYASRFVLFDDSLDYRQRWKHRC